MRGPRASLRQVKCRIRRLAHVLGAALLVAVASACTNTVRNGRQQQAAALCRRPMLGVLEADTAFMASDAAAGVCFATLNIDWAKWDTAPDQVNTSYRTSAKRQAAAYRAAGWTVAVDAGLQKPPSWVLALPGGQLVDQNGERSRTADFEFSAAVRAAAAVYIRDMVKSLGHIDYYRLGLSESGEAFYPNVVDDGWWAFGPALGDGTVLPAGVVRSPLPGWVPGSAKWNDQPVSQAQVASWYDWYFSAMVNAHAWEMATFRSVGFDGDLELVVPGSGTLPGNYLGRLSENLAPDPAIDFYSTMNSGAVWWKLLDALPSLSRVVLDISSVYDASGSPRGNVCQPSDAYVAPTDRQIVDWSDTRWLTYLATKHQMTVMGENPGNTPAADIDGIVALVQSCHLEALQWAWDYTLHDDNGSAPLAAVAAAMSSAHAQRPAEPSP